MHYLQCDLAETTKDGPKMQEIGKPSTRTLTYLFTYFFKVCHPRCVCN